MQLSLLDNQQPNDLHQPVLHKASVSRCTLLHGDCLELMSSIPDGSIDMIFADLPYGTTNCQWDIRIPFDNLWQHWSRVAKENAAIILTGQQPFSSDIVQSNRKNFRYEIIWEKSNPVGFLDARRKPLRTHENILVFYRAKPTYNPQKWRISEIFIDRRKTFNKAVNNNTSYGEHGQKERIKDDGTRFPLSVLSIPSHWSKGMHPTQKPVELLDWLIKTYTNEGDTVLDCVMGSGTTGVSCKKNNRHFIGIEKEKSFYDVAVSRVTVCSG